MYTVCSALSNPVTEPTHTYAPISFSLTLVIVYVVDVARICRSPSFIHTILGEGLPATSQVKVTESPRSTSTFAAFVVIVGASITKLG